MYPSHPTNLLYSHLTFHFYPQCFTFLPLLAPVYCFLPIPLYIFLFYLSFSSYSSSSFLFFITPAVLFSYSNPQFIPFVLLTPLILLIVFLSNLSLRFFSPHYDLISNLFYSLLRLVVICQSLSYLFLCFRFSHLCHICPTHPPCASFWFPFIPLTLLVTQYALLMYYSYPTHSFCFLCCYNCSTTY